MTTQSHRLYQKPQDQDLPVDQPSPRFETQQLKKLPTYRSSINLIRHGIDVEDMEENNDIEENDGENKDQNECQLQSQSDNEILENFDTPDRTARVTFQSQSVSDDQGDDGRIMNDALYGDEQQLINMDELQNLMGRADAIHEEFKNGTNNFQSTQDFKSSVIESKSNEQATLFENLIKITKFFYQEQYKQHQFKEKMKLEFLDLQNDNQVFIKESEEIEDILKRQQVQNQQVTQELREKETEIQDLMEQVSTQQGDITSLEQMVRLNAQQSTERRQTITQKRNSQVTKEKDLQTQLDLLTKENERYENECREANIQNNNLQALFDGRDKSVKEYRYTLKLQELKLQAYRSQVDELKKKCALMDQENEDLAQQQIQMEMQMQCMTQIPDQNPIYQGHKQLENLSVIEGSMIDQTLGSALPITENQKHSMIEDQLQQYAESEKSLQDQSFQDLPVSEHSSKNVDLYKTSFQQSANSKQSPQFPYDYNEVATTKQSQDNTQMLIDQAFPNNDTDIDEDEEKLLREAFPDDHLQESQATKSIGNQDQIDQPLDQEQSENSGELIFDGVVSRKSSQMFQRKFTNYDAYSKITKTAPGVIVEEDTGNSFVTDIKSKQNFKNLISQLTAKGKSPMKALKSKIKDYNTASNQKLINKEYVNFYDLENMILNRKLSLLGKHRPTLNKKPQKFDSLRNMLEENGNQEDVVLTSRHKGNSKSKDFDFLKAQSLLIQFNDQVSTDQISFKNEPYRDSQYINKKGNKVSNGSFKKGNTATKKPLMNKLIFDLGGYKETEKKKLRTHAKNPFKSPFFGGEDKKFEFPQSNTSKESPRRSTVGQKNTANNHLNLNHKNTITKQVTEISFDHDNSMDQIQQTQNLVQYNTQYTIPTVEDELHEFYEEKIFDFISDQKIANERHFTIVSKLTDTIQDSSDVKQRGRINSETSAFTSKSHMSKEKEGEMQFFKLLVLSEMMNMPQFMIDSLIQKDIKEMYKRVKHDKIMFNNFHEWISHDIKKSMFCQDNDFITREQEWNKMIEDQKKAMENTITKVQEAPSSGTMQKMQKQFRLDFQRDQQMALQDLELEKKKSMQ